MRKQMRRSDREITNLDEIIGVLRRADTIRLGLHDEPYPYIVPLSFSYEVTGDKIVLYFHGAREGLKHELIARNPCVCVEADIFHRYADSPPNNLTAEYEILSVSARRSALPAGTPQKALTCCDHCGYAGFEYDHAALNVTAVYRITLDSFSGKKRFVGGASV